MIISILNVVNVITDYVGDYSFSEKVHVEIEMKGHYVKTSLLNA